MDKNILLERSVITSSSLRKLRNLFAEVSNINSVFLFDLLVLGQVDIEQMIDHGYLSFIPEGKLDLITRVLKDATHCPEIVRWIEKQCTAAHTMGRIEFAALATYFPNITSINKERRQAAIDALVSTAYIAAELVKLRRLRQPIIEIVCGTILDPCGCRQCNTEEGIRHHQVYVYKREDKISLLLDSLQKALDKIKTICPETHIVFALELEPGETYVLNDVTGLRNINDKLEGEFKMLGDHVGFNLDIAHMKIADISADELYPFRDRFVHAHISDHPGIHTIDQTVGTWTSIERRDGDYYPFLYLLAERKRTISELGLPFSGVVALELEGCNRIGCIHRSLVAMQHLLATVQNYPKNILDDYSQSPQF